MPTKVTWVNGTFDVLHMGHIKLFQKAWTLGHKVIVGVDSDERVRQMKGISRPVNKLEDRIAFLQSIKYISAVQPFNTDEELEALIKHYSPEFFVIGEEYKAKRIIGKEWANEMVYVPKYGGLSSSNIVNGTHNS